MRTPKAVSWRCLHEFYTCYGNIQCALYRNRKTGYLHVAVKSKYHWYVTDQLVEGA